MAPSAGRPPGGATATLALVPEPLHLVLADGDWRQLAANPRRYIHRLLKVGEFQDQDGRPTRITKDLIARLAEGFRRLGHVPLFEHAAGRHAQGPAAYRGQLVAVRAVGGGSELEVEVETTDDGARLIEADPRIELSATLDGLTGEPRLLDACLVPRGAIAGLGGWQTDDGREVHRLACYSGGVPFGRQGLSEDELSALREMLSAYSERRLATTETLEQLSEADLASFRQLLTEREEERAALEALEGESDSDEEKPEKPTAESAQLSSMRASHNEMRRQLAGQTWRAERDAYARAGVPDASLDAAADTMSNPDADHDAFRRVLDAQKGIVQLGATGSATGEEADEAAARTAKVDKWSEQADA